MYKEILDAVFAKHPEVADCEAHRAMLAEAADDGTNYDVDSWEKILGQLVSSGQILARRTEEMEKEAELQRSKAERARRMADSDYKRKLRDPNFYHVKDKTIEKLRKQEQSAKEENPLLQLSVEELRAKVRAESEAKGFKRNVRMGDSADVW